MVTEGVVGVCSLRDGLRCTWSVAWAWAGGGGTVEVWLGYSDWMKDKQELSARCRSGGRECEGPSEGQAGGSGTDASGGEVSGRSF